MATALPKGKVIGAISKLLIDGDLDREQGLMLRSKISADASVTDESIRDDAKAFLAPLQAEQLLRALSLA